ncbi:zinc-binding dehydrogenase [Streptomyces sp. NPDC055400]
MYAAICRPKSRSCTTRWGRACGGPRTWGRSASATPSPPSARASAASSPPRRRRRGASTVVVTGLAADAHKLALAREFGADHTVVVDEQDTVTRITEITNGELADVVLEMTPMAGQPLDDALRAARHGGRIVAGLKGGAKIPLDSDLIVNKALTLVGAYGVDSRGYAEAIRLLESGSSPFEKLHTHTFELADTVEALDALAGEVPPARRPSTPPSDREPDHARGRGA